MVSFSDQIPFPVGFVSFEPKNVPLSSGFSAVTLVSGLQCHTGRWDLNATMSQSQNGETLSHRWWQQAGTSRLLASLTQHSAQRVFYTPSSQWIEVLMSRHQSVHQEIGVLHIFIPGCQDREIQFGMGTESILDKPYWLSERWSLVSRPWSTWGSDRTQTAIHMIKDTHTGGTKLPSFLREPQEAGLLYTGQGGLQAKEVTIPFSTWGGGDLRGIH
jgi:hypothetical protein